jgi:hypothetical protein
MSQNPPDYARLLVQVYRLFREEYHVRGVENGHSVEMQRDQENALPKQKAKENGQ